MEIHKLQFDFIWGYSDDHKLIHAVKWISIIQPKSMGGFGLRNLVETNKACLLKLGWKLVIGDNNIWFQVVRWKSDRGNNNFDLVRAKTNDSSLWKNIVENWPTMKDAIFWDIGNDMKTDMWIDSRIH